MMSNLFQARDVDADNKGWSIGSLNLEARATVSWPRCNHIVSNLFQPDVDSNNDSWTIHNDVSPTPVVRTFLPECHFS